MKIRAPHGSVGCATPSVSARRTPPQAVRRPKAAGPLDPASATYDPSGCGEVLVVLRVWAVIASAATAASSASAASANSRTARRGISSAASRSGAAQHVAERLTHERVEVDRQQTVGSRVVAEVEEQELALLVELPAVARGTVELPDVPATRLDGYGLRHGLRLRLVLRLGFGFRFGFRLGLRCGLGLDHRSGRDDRHRLGRLRRLFGRA